MLQEEALLLAEDIKEPKKVRQDLCNVESLEAYVNEKQENAELKELRQQLKQLVSVQRAQQENWQTFNTSCLMKDAIMKSQIQQKPENQGMKQQVHQLQRVHVIFAKEWDISKKIACSYKKRKKIK